MTSMHVDYQYAKNQFTDKNNILFIQIQQFLFLKIRQLQKRNNCNNSEVPTYIQ